MSLSNGTVSLDSSYPVINKLVMFECVFFIKIVIKYKKTKKKYTAKESSSCNSTTGVVGAQMSSLTIGQKVMPYGTPAGNETWLANAVKNMGPVSVCLYVSDKFMLYQKGMKCSSYFNDICIFYVDHNLIYL